jgi:hypothetical protein
VSAQEARGGRGRRIGAAPAVLAGGREIGQGVEISGGLLGWRRASSARSERITQYGGRVCRRRSGGRIRRTEFEPRQLHQLGIIEKEQAASIRDAIVATLDAESVQMGVIPAHQLLDDSVKVGNR